jgi:hypothetical protein
MLVSYVLTQIATTDKDTHTLLAHIELDNLLLLIRVEIKKMREKNKIIINNQKMRLILSYHYNYDYS